MTEQLSIAIDGPAASGKSTLAEALAKKLGYLYFDTGAMYRAVTLAALRQGIDTKDQTALAGLAETAEIDLRPPSQADGRLSDVLLNGEDITWEIRSKDVDLNVSDVSAVPAVRKALSEQQRRIGLRGKVVMAGRDIGTVVLPEADLKIYLDASPEERARRRHSELVAQGKEANYEKVLAALIERDKIDSSRAVAPLKPADDAVMLKSDGMGREQVLDTVLKLVAERSRGRAETEAEAGNQQPFRVPLSSWIFRYTFRPIFRVLFRLLCRIRLEGLENVPAKGPYIIAYNHVSNFEPPFVLAFWPYFPEAVAGADVFQRKAVNLFVGGYGAIPVRRGEYDRKVIDTMLEVLASGRPLAIAPEGGRSHDPGLRPARAGVAYLMDRAGVPVVPVGISGTYDQVLKDALGGKRPELVMRVGPAFDLPPIEGRGEARRNARQANADLVMRHIASLLAPEHWGVYKPLEK